MRAHFAMCGDLDYKVGERLEKLFLAGAETRFPLTKRVTVDGVDLLVDGVYTPYDFRYLDDPILCYNIQVDSFVAVVFDVKSRASFDFAKRLTDIYLMGFSGNVFPIIAIGITESEREEGREVSTSEASGYFLNLSRPVQYFETNPRTGQGANQAFIGGLIQSRALNP